MGLDCLWDSEEQHKNGLYSWSSHSFCIRQDCLYDSESNIGNGMECILSVLLLAVPEAVSSHTKMRSRSAVQSIFCVGPRCPRGSLVPYKSEENQFHPVLALLGTGAPMLLSTGPTPSSLESRHVPLINLLQDYCLYLTAKGQGSRTVNIVVN